MNLNLEIPDDLAQRLAAAGDDFRAVRLRDLPLKNTRPAG